MTIFYWALIKEANFDNIANDEEDHSHEKQQSIATTNSIF